MSMPVLAVHLCKNLPRSGSNQESGKRPFFFQPPVVSVIRSQIEGQRDCGTPLVLDIVTKIEAMLRVKLPLVTCTTVFIQDVREAETMENSCRCKAQKHSPEGRVTDHAANLNLTFRAWCSHNRTSILLFFHY